MLYNKYRPKSISEVIGNSKTITFITNAIAQNKVPNAIIFYGERGIGKTTLARLLAKSLKCGKDKCTCNTCTMIDQSSHPDVREIDAASNSGVGDTRAMIESTNYVATDKKNRVFIIDEVHMLSKAAFNALLKTLEEPSDHVYFILATTEFEKIPATVLSRCVAILMQKVDKNNINDYLCRICDMESVDYDPQAVDLIAENANGCVRDAVVMLEHACILYNKKFTLKDIRNDFRIEYKEHVVKIVDAILNNDVENALSLNTECSILNKRFVMLAMIQEVYKRIINNPNDTSIPILIRTWEIMKNIYIDSKHIENASMMLDMCIINATFGNRLPAPIELVDDLMQSGEIVASALECFPNAQEKDNGTV